MRRLGGEEMVKATAQKRHWVRQVLGTSKKPVKLKQGLGVRVWGSIKKMKLERKAGSGHWIESYGWWVAGCFCIRWTFSKWSDEHFEKLALDAMWRVDCRDKSRSRDVVGETVTVIQWEVILPCSGVTIVKWKEVVQISWIMKSSSWWFGCGQVWKAEQSGLIFICFDFDYWMVKMPIINLYL